MLSWNIGSAIGRLLMPPTLFYILIAIALWHWPKRWARTLAVSSLALLYALSTPVVAYSLLDAMTAEVAPLTAAEIAALPRPDTMIVVLPGGKRSALEYPLGESASPLTIERARYGAWLARETGLPLAIPGGRHRGVLSEAELARKFIENELGQPVALIESESLDTRQNAANLVQPLQEAKVQRVVLVTDARHMPRAVQAFSAVGFEVVPAPMWISARSAPVTGPSSFMASAPALATSAAVSHELVGRVWYWIRSVPQGLSP